MTTKVVANGKPTVLMMNLLMPYLHDSLESKFNLLPLWEQANKEAYLTSKADSIRGVVTSSSSLVDSKFIDRLPNLEIVASFSVGLDKVDLSKCRERGIAVANTPDVLTDDCADLAIALLLAIMRQICSADRYVRKGCWPKQGDYPLAYKMSGKRLGIVGLGRIGMAVAKRAEAFGCQIQYYARSEKKDIPYKFYSSVLDLANASTMLVVCCALTKETTKIIDRKVLDALGPEIFVEHLIHGTSTSFIDRSLFKLRRVFFYQGCFQMVFPVSKTLVTAGFLVNISRGGVIDEAELVKALLECRLGGAGLDVFEKEPQVPQELWHMDHVVLLPHVGSATWDTRRAMADLVVSNLEAQFAGKPLPTPVT